MLSSSPKSVCANRLPSTPTARSPPHCAPPGLPVDDPDPCRRHRRQGSRRVFPQHRRHRRCRTHPPGGGNVSTTPIRRHPPRPTVPQFRSHRGCMPHRRRHRGHRQRPRPRRPHALDAMIQRNKRTAAVLILFAGSWDADPTAHGGLPGRRRRCSLPAARHPAPAQRPGRVPAASTRATNLPVGTALHRPTRKPVSAAASTSWPT